MKCEQLRPRISVLCFSQSTYSTGSRQARVQQLQLCLRGLRKKFDNKYADEEACRRSTRQRKELRLQFVWEIIRPI